MMAFEIKVFPPQKPYRMFPDERLDAYGKEKRQPKTSELPPYAHELIPETVQESLLKMAQTDQFPMIKRSAEMLIFRQCIDDMRDIGIKKRWKTMERHPNAFARIILSPHIWDRKPMTITAAAESLLMTRKSYYKTWKDRIDDLQENWILDWKSKKVLPG